MLRDKRELNRLLAGQLETRDEELKQAIMHALLDWNRSPPHIGNYTLATHPNKFLLLQYAAIQVLISAGVWHSREHMPSSDGVLLPTITQSSQSTKAGFSSTTTTTSARSLTRKRRTTSSAPTATWGFRPSMAQPCISMGSGGDVSSGLPQEILFLASV